MSYSRDCATRRFEMLVFIVAAVGGCATDDPDDSYCETDCPKPPTKIIHVEDMRDAKVEVTSTLTFEEGRPSFPTVHVVFWTSADHACAVVDDAVEVSLAGMPGYALYGGVRSHAARWFCDPFVIDFLPKLHQADAKVVVSDVTGTIELDLGDLLEERSLVSLDHPDWVFPANQPAGFRWHPAQDIGTRLGIGLTTYYTVEAVPAPVQVPITSLDAGGGFQLVMPSISGTQVLRLQVEGQRSCGPQCTVTVKLAGDHTAMTN